MQFSRSTFDLAIGEPAILYQTEIKDISELCDHLNVYVGTGGGTLSLSTEQRLGSDRFPSGVLVDQSSDQPVGLIANDFVTSGQFGIVELDAQRISIAEKIGDSFDRLEYENSMLILG